MGFWWFAKVEKRYGPFFFLKKDVNMNLLVTNITFFYSSWLLRDPTMHVRTSYGPYIERVDKFFQNLIPLVKNMQFTSSEKINPIIAVQVLIERKYLLYLNKPVLKTSTLAFT